MAVVSAVDEVDDVASADTKGDPSYGESAIAGVDTTLDRKGTIESGRVGVSNSDIDGIGVTRGELPVDDVGGVLHPEGTGTGTGDGQGKRRGDEAESSESFYKHFVGSLVMRDGEQETKNVGIERVWVWG